MTDLHHRGGFAWGNRRETIGQKNTYQASLARGGDICQGFLWENIRFSRRVSLFFAIEHGYLEMVTCFTKHCYYREFNEISPTESTPHDSPPPLRGITNAATFALPPPPAATGRPTTPSSAERCRPPLCLLNGLLTRGGN